VDVNARDFPSAVTQVVNDCNAKIGLLDERVLSQKATVQRLETDVTMANDQLVVCVHACVYMCVSFCSVLSWSFLIVFDLVVWLLQAAQKDNAFLTRRASQLQTQVSALDV